MEITQVILEPAALAKRLGLPSAETIRLGGELQLSIGRVRLVPLNDDACAAAVELLAGLLNLHAPTHPGASSNLMEGENK